MPADQGHDQGPSCAPSDNRRPKAISDGDKRCNWAVSVAPREARRISENTSDRVSSIRKRLPIDRTSTKACEFGAMGGAG